MKQLANRFNDDFKALRVITETLPSLLKLEASHFTDRQNAIELRIGQLISLLLSMQEAEEALAGNGKYKVKVEVGKIQRMVTSMQEHVQTQRWSELYLQVEVELIPLVNVEQAVEDLSNKQPFIEDVWEKVLSVSEKISIFYLIRTFIPNLKVADKWLFPKANRFFQANYRFVDAWVVMNTTLSIATVFLAWATFVPLWLKYILIFYGFTRVFEIFIYQLNVIFVHPYRNNGTRYYLRGYRRMTILLLHNFAEIIFWFAGTYLVTKMLVGVNPVTAISQSFIQMLTYSFDLSDDKLPLLALFVLQAQAIMGVFMTVLSLARFTSLFPQPETLDEREKEMMNPGSAVATNPPQNTESNTTGNEQVTS